MAPSVATSRRRFIRSPGRHAPRCQPLRQICAGPPSPRPCVSCCPFWPSLHPVAAEYSHCEPQVAVKGQMPENAGFPHCDKNMARPLPKSIDETHKLLGEADYVADRSLATALYLGLVMQRPLFLEGEAGVGKTEIAKVSAAALGRELIRLQC